MRVVSVKNHFQDSQRAFHALKIIFRPAYAWSKSQGVHLDRLGELCDGV